MHSSKHILQKLKSSSVITEEKKETPAPQRLELHLKKATPVKVSELQY